MKLLIITQKIDKNDDILGFFHGWVEEFAKKCEKVVVICLEKGEYNLPENVKVLSLGKEEGNFSPLKLKYLLRFYKYIYRERKNYDNVFVHMNSDYVVLGRLFWKLWNKKIYLWYVHKAVPLSLKLAEKFVENIFTASRESCRLESNKIVITGHGIDVNKFKIFLPTGDLPKGDKIITAGRIAPSKNIHLLIEVAEILRNNNLDFEIRVAGSPILEQDRIYFEKLRKLVEEKNLQNEIKFAGKIPNKDIAGFYQKGNLFVNFSDTGSLDKAVLEAMSCGLLVLTSNEAFKNILPEKYLTSKNPEEIAKKIITLSRGEPDLALREYVVKNHSLGNLIPKIINVIKIRAN